MSSSPAVAFGFFATTVALKAKCGQLTDRFRADLAQKTLEFVPDDADARVAILAFLATNRDFPVAAGQALLDFICAWMEDRSPKDVERVLQEIKSQPEYEWQDRADLQ
ncbi:hypothetical protein JI58_07130 [Marinosulfonomonas sp. PRT-SC04]|nr:hypothetical protein JI58_07130 [Marinosulfonomonas sp. PRT-SC04]